MTILDHKREATGSSPLAYRVNDAARASGISRSSLYELISSGALTSIKVAGRRLILADDLRSFLESARETT